MQQRSQLPTYDSWATFCALRKEFFLLGSIHVWLFLWRSFLSYGSTFHLRLASSPGPPPRSAPLLFPPCRSLPKQSPPICRDAVMDPGYRLQCAQPVFPVSDTWRDARRGGELQPFHVSGQLVHKIISLRSSCSRCEPPLPALYLTRLTLDYLREGISTPTPPMCSP